MFRGDVLDLNAVFFSLLKAAHVRLTLSATEPAIMHGKSGFLKQEKVAKLLRESGGGQYMRMYKLKHVNIP